MRGFAVAAGGWDDVDDAQIALRVVPAGAEPGQDPPLGDATVVDLDAHRTAKELANGDGTVIYAW